MPRGQPFTQLCARLADLRAGSRRADLHLHSTHSDGAYSPAEIVRRAAALALPAIAITDHDSCTAWAEAHAAAGQRSNAPEIITGVEISTEFRGRELHLLGYFFDPDDTGLTAALTVLRAERRQRFREMLDRLATLGVHLDGSELEQRWASGHTLGRRDLASLLVRQGQAATLAEAFARYLGDGGPVAVPKRGWPVADAIARVHAAHGVTSWAHPPESLDRACVAELAEMGLDALEAVYPTFRAARERHVREVARACGLAISGGSDCHGPTPVSRAIGVRGVDRAELAALRDRAGVGAGR